MQAYTGHTLQHWRSISTRVSIWVATVVLAALHRSCRALDRARSLCNDRAHNNYFNWENLSHNFYRVQVSFLKAICAPPFPSTTHFCACPIMNISYMHTYTYIMRTHPDPWILGHQSVCNYSLNSPIDCPRVRETHDFVRKQLRDNISASKISGIVHGRAFFFPSAHLIE